MKSDQPKLLNIIALIIVVSCALAIYTQSVIAWAIFIASAFLFGLVLIYFDRQQRLIMNQPITDLEYIKNMLSSQKVTYDIKSFDSYIELSVERGYIGFFVDVKFNFDGMFMDIGAWE